MKYLEGLNEAQKRAVLTTRGPIMVLAGAGSGKTRVLASRTTHLIHTGIPPNEIMAVTFTNKAAREMRERIQTMIVHNELQPFISTFHGLGRELLECYGKKIGVPRHFNIYDRDDSERAIARALSVMDVSTKELSPRTVLGRISRAKSDGIRAEEFHEKQSRASFGARVAAQAWLHYEKILESEKSLDFDDLIALPVRLLELYNDVREEVQNRWKYLHIDEYQDTSSLQARFVALLAEKYNNIFVVGDADQCIYSWRNATVENLLKFDRAYPDAETIVLEQNYRSTKKLVNAANAVIKKNKNRKEKKSITENSDGDPIVLCAAHSADEEAQYIAQKIQKLNKQGVAYKDIAILFRTNFQSRALEEGLLCAGIPYKILGTRFFARKEVKDVLAWMRLALDSSRETDKIRAAAAPPRGIGKVTLGKLVTGQRAGLRAGELAKIEQFEHCIQELSVLADTLIPSAFVKAVAEKSGMQRIFLEEGNEEGRERFQNIEELATVAARYDCVPGKDGIALFLAEAALASDQDALDHPSYKSASEEGEVTLMTVHAAKGLEFDTVFVSGMEEGLFPHHGLSFDASFSARDEEEERRLFYVAITRAKKRLFLTFAYARTIYGSSTLAAPSSFLADIPFDCVVYDNHDYEHNV